MALRSTDIVAPTVLTQVAHESNPVYTAAIEVEDTELPDTLTPDAPTLTVAEYHFSDITKDATSSGV